jgi:hypothetical protein
LTKVEKAASVIETTEKPIFYATKNDVDTVLQGIENGQITLLTPCRWEAEKMPAELVSAILDTQNPYFKACIGVNRQIIYCLMCHPGIGPQLQPLLKTIDGWIEFLPLLRPYAWNGREKK